MTDKHAPAGASDQAVRPLTQLQTSIVALGVCAMGVGMTINFVVVTPLAREAGLSERQVAGILTCLLYTSPSPRDKRQSRMPSSA